MTICTTTTISIRRATAGDVPQIADMMQLVSGREHSVEAARTMTADFAPGRFYGWLAFAGNEPAGLTTVEPCILERRGTAINAGYWRYLWVRPDQRRTTLYPRLVFTMIAEAAVLGMDLVYGAIRRPDVAAGHIALGMQRVGEIPVLARPLRPARLFSKFHGFADLFVRLSAIPDLPYAQYLSLRRSSTRSGYVITDIAATEVDPGAVIPALREIYAQDLQRRPTPESFANRYYSNSDGAQYRVLTVGRSGAVSAAIVYRIAVRGNDIRNLVIMEMGYRFSDQAAMKFGLLAIEKQALQLGCEVILFLSSRWSSQTFLRKLGYFRSNETYILMKKPTGRNATAIVTENLNDWYFTFADHDAF
jgi:hypothetical protein